LRGTNAEQIVSIKWFGRLTGWPVCRFGFDLFRGLWSATGSTGSTGKPANLLAISALNRQTLLGLNQYLVLWAGIFIIWRRMIQLDPNPVFRKVILPWYDSETLCVVVIIFMVAVILFGLAGISVARETVEYRDYIWVPVFLVVMSSIVIVSVSIRLIKRYRRRLPR